MVEVLKQPQYQPVPVEEQVVVLYAVTNGYLDDVDTASVRKWEQDFLAWLRSSRPEVLTTIRDGQKLTDEVVTDLESAIEAFKPMFDAAA